MRVLRHGLDIAQCHMADGYSIRNRVRHAWRSLPPLIHCQGFKPWDAPSPRPLFLDVSPYLLVAQRYRDVLAGDTSWLATSSRWGRMLRLVSGDEPSVAGMLPALTTQLQRALRIRTRLRALTALGFWSASDA